MPCGKPPADYLAFLVELLQWLPERVHFNDLERCGGWSVRIPARWFAWSFPFARLAVAALGLGSFRVGMARAARRGLEVSLMAAVDQAVGQSAPVPAAQPAPSRRHIRSLHPLVHRCKREKCLAEKCLAQTAGKFGIDLNTVAAINQWLNPNMPLWPNAEIWLAVPPEAKAGPGPSQCS